MYIRCVQCHVPTWIPSELGPEPLGAVCRACGRRYQLRATPELGSSSRDQYQNAQRFSEANGVDLPSAYSVLLGLMTLEQARVRREQPRPAAPPPPTPP
ncbi:MAG TPA: hypothetical protein VJS92_09980, partial [Candidatus Polarisedimenticolaceae bacterium]|nr:hypothetical protein [Candidatus Polarisedimenticolaceae bacterium]